jgi:hypothetical protein
LEDAIAEVAVQHLSGPLPSICDVHPDVPPDVDEIIQHCMAKNLGDGYQTADKLITALNRVLDRSESKAHRWPFIPITAGVILGLLLFLLHQSRISPSAIDANTSGYIGRGTGDTRTSSCSSRCAANTYTQNRSQPNKHQCTSPYTTFSRTG